MKKIVGVLLSLMMIFALSACGNRVEEPSNEMQEATPEINRKRNMGKRSSQRQS